SLPQSLTFPLVVFVTGYDQYALEAFEANALAYLLKPVEAERLAQVIDRAHRIQSYDSRREAEVRRIASFVQETPAPLRQPLRQIVGRKRDRYVLLSHEEVVFFRAEDGIVRAHTATENYWVNHQLSHLEACLPEELFFRAHRSAIVNLAKVKEMR